MLMRPPHVAGCGRGDHGRRPPAPARADPPHAGTAPARLRPGHPAPRPRGRGPAPQHPQPHLLRARPPLHGRGAHRRLGGLPAAVEAGRGERPVPSREQPLLQGDLLLDRLRHGHLPLPQQRAGGGPVEMGKQTAAELRHRRTALLQQPAAPPRDLHRLLGLRLGPGLRPVDGRGRRPARRGHPRLRHPPHRSRRPQRHPTGDPRGHRRIRGPHLPRGETPPALRRAGDRRDLRGAAGQPAAATASYRRPGRTRRPRPGPRDRRPGPSDRFRRPGPSDRLHRPGPSGRLPPAGPVRSASSAASSSSAA